MNRPNALSRPARISDDRLASLRQLCAELPNFMPSVTLYGHRITVLHLQAGPTPPNYHFPRHVQSVYEGHLVLAGTGWYDVSTAQKMEPGMLVLHEPGVSHEWRTIDSKLDWMIFWLRIEPAVSVPEPQAWPRVPAAVWEAGLMVEDYRARRHGWQDRVAAQLTSILSHLLGICKLPEVIPSSPTAEQAILESIETYIRENMAQPLQASTIASNVGISTRTLHRLYRNAHGEGVMSHLRTIRLLHAAQLLLESSWSLPAICEEVGINGSSYFCKLFQRMFHATPMQYRAGGIEAPNVIPTKARIGKHGSMSGKRPGL